MRGDVTARTGSASLGIFCVLLVVGLLIGRPALGAEEVVRIYDYKGFDTNGTLWVSGVITLRLDETVQIKGDWRLQIIPRDKLKLIGPQDGAGKIFGQLRGDIIFLNLNPGQLHNNIYLEGSGTGVNNAEIKGKWGHYGFEGKVIEGRFEMVRRPELPPPTPSPSTPPPPSPPAPKVN